MIDREKVISVLSAYKNHSFGDKAEKVTVEEIITLLKAQQPRVIPRNDLSRYQDYAWVEFRRVSRLGVRDVDDIRFLLAEPSTASNYNKTWRCWTSRPTDEQRKAVKLG